MSNDFKFELNPAGVSKLLNSKEMQSVLVSYASNVKNKAGKGYMYSTRKGTDRFKGYVHTTTKQAQKDNLKNNTLLKALGS